MDKPIELKPLDPKDKEALDSGDSGSMLDDLKDLTKTKRAVPDAPLTEGTEAEHVRRMYNDYKAKVIGDKEPTDQQLTILQGIADRLLTDQYADKTGVPMPGDPGYQDWMRQSVEKYGPLGGKK